MGRSTMYFYSICRPPIAVSPVLTVRGHPVLDLPRRGCHFFVTMFIGYLKNVASPFPSACQL